MTRTNLRLVIKVARRYEGLGLELMDLIQEGNLGLIRGLRDFDPARGYRISTYVFWWIRQSILKALDEKSRAVRVPERFGEIGRKSVSIIDAWYDKHGVVPTANEVATELRALGGSFANLTTARYTGMMETLHTTTTTHLMDEVWDNIMCQNDGTVAAEAEDEVDKYYSKQLLTLAQAMVCLNDQEQYLVRACCIDHAKVDDVADALGVKKSRVQQIQSSAIKKLRLYLGLDAATASLKR
jgi:RNA polymerase sigma factor (sigma-70 family)